MENLKTIVKGTTAKLSFVCAGKIYYHIETEKHLYQLEIKSMDEELKTTYMEKSIRQLHLCAGFEKGLRIQTIHLFN
ncbi:hypothetical protein [Sunxiuqinia indica]|uniref:hypothetical protein n=1 Tax=Sunxiuqinia indica TaxID=2692584 RepID=UPI00135775D5|nr:hypothetical protein [Sunxiuqinia indica]